MHLVEIKYKLKYLLHGMSSKHFSVPTNLYRLTCTNLKIDLTTLHVSDIYWRVTAIKL